MTFIMTQPFKGSVNMDLQEDANEDDYLRKDQIWILINEQVVIFGHSGGFHIFSSAHTSTPINQILVYFDFYIIGYFSV